MVGRARTAWPAVARPLNRDQTAPIGGAGTDTGVPEEEERMPTTINGIGTNYVGKKNLDVRTDVCGYCGKEAQLSSYDTRLFFVVLFIPVVPLGRRRIIEQCSRCSRHRAMALEEYERLRTEALTDLEAEQRRNPRDPQAAMAFNAALFQFHEVERGNEHCAEMLRSFPDEARVQFYGAAVLEGQGRGAEAKALFDRAYELDPNDPGIARAKAIGLIEEGALSQARSLLRQLTEAERDPGVSIMLARSYQEREEHMAAMEIFREVLNEVPQAAKNKEFRRLVKASEKAMGQTSSVLPGRFLLWGK